MPTDPRNKHHGGAATAGTRVGSRAPQRRPHEPHRVTHEQHATPGPFGLMRQMQDEVDRWFNRAGVDASWMSPTAWLSSAAEKIGEWTPAVDAFQRGNEFVIRVDVPGMTRNDLTVEIGEDAVTIGGERKHEEKDDRDGVFWSERSHGRFTRVVPLPPGAISDSARANFSNGVLEIVVQSPSEETRRGRRIDITGHDDTTKKAG